ncbi:MAG: hypothetical protein H6718_18330 [Polyangiaceae bacterium]|nr:hypothetical protein [Polyangiaceae bacterium]
MTPERPPAPPTLGSDRQRRRAPRSATPTLSRRTTKLPKFVSAGVSASTFGALALGVIVGCSSCKRSGGDSGADTPPPAQLTHVEKPGPTTVQELPPATTTHPRLWVRQQDLDQLRSWATPDNPIYAQGLRPVIEQAKQDVDEKRMPSSDQCAYQGRYCEQTAMVLAFASLLQKDAGEARAYAERAKSVLLPMLARVKANKQDDPLAEPRFSVADRSRWAGEAFPLTVDWIYPYLSKEDKALIRTVFLRWAEEQLKATVTDYNHPEPVGKLNDPVLLKDRKARRYGANNFYTAHARNLGLMALALDAADDPKEPDAGRQYPCLRDYLQNVTGAWLYVSDSVLRNDAKGGIAPEGFEYAPRSLAFLLQLYLALETAGEANEERYGTQVLRWKNPFWQELVPAYLNALSPRTVKSQRSGTQVYLPAWTGDGEVYELFDFADSFIPLGISARLRGEQALYDQTRWIQKYTPAGGAEYLNKRASAEGGSVPFRQAILYFLLYDPKAKPAEDPRGKLPPHHLASGTGRLAVRQSWKPDAAWFNFNCGWAEIDHQHGDAGDFGLYLKGEWISKERVGYGGVFERSLSHNTLAVENSKPDHHEDKRRRGLWESGSQWALGHTGDPVMRAFIGNDYVSTHCSMGGMYNSAYEGVKDVEAVERHLVWLEPSTIVFYDAVRTARAEQFKQAWLHFEALPKVEGDHADVTTPGGQHVRVSALLPENAKLRAEAYKVTDDWESKPASGETMLFDLLTEAGSKEKQQQFLHVLQVADSPLKPERFKQGQGDEFVGASLGPSAVAFSTKRDAPKANFSVPAQTKLIFVAGLKPNSDFKLGTKKSGDALVLSIEPGSGVKSDDAGVIRFAVP